MNALLTRLKAFPLNETQSLNLGEGQFLSGAVETATPSRNYYWNGLRRGGDPKQPVWLFQYTLCGHGLFQLGRTAQKATAGRAFCATIPSPSLYYGDPDCPKWLFFWIMINCPYVTGRLLRHANLNNSLLTLPPESPLVRGAISLLYMMRGEALDIYHTEEQLFRWMLDCERWADQQRHPVEPKIQLLEFVRNYTLLNLGSKIHTEDLANAKGMTRSNFAHFFRKTTGRNPATQVLAIRLEEAARLLSGSGNSIKEVAAATGFTDSNHLCKCFRRHFKMSPGDYRALYLSDQLPVRRPILIRP